MICDRSITNTELTSTQWATQIAEALNFVHSAGVVHGDLTCHNIFLGKGLDAKVADFALPDQLSMSSALASSSNILVTFKNRGNILKGLCGF